MQPPRLFMPSVTQMAVEPHAEREKLPCSFYLINFWDFLLFLISLPDETKTLKRELQSEHVVGYARAEFISLLWTKHLTKPKMAHEEVIPAWLGSGTLQTHSSPRAVTFSVSITTTLNPETHFRRETSMQRERFSFKRILGLMNPYFLIENNFLYLNKRITHSSSLDTGFALRPHLPAQEPAIYQLLPVPRIKSDHPSAGTALPTLPALYTSPAAWDEHPASGKSLLPSPVLLYKLLEDWFLTADGRCGDAHPSLPQRPGSLKSLWPNFSRAASAGSQGEMLTRRFCFSSLIRAPYVKTQGVKNQSLI